MAKTIEFKATIGVVEGYGHDNEGAVDATAIVAKVWQDAAKREFEANGIYVSASVSPSKVVYHTDWGCPVGGEVAATVAGSANPAFTEDLEAWKQAVLRVVGGVKAELKQTTVVVEFGEVEHHYLAD
jgi:hypothetical protein